jgi:CelD/BcsL family acetyltransferase involved in cellulose biosynthesis
VFGDRHQPLFVTVNDFCGVVAIAPLTVKTGLLGEQVVRFLGDGRADYCDFLARENKPKALEAIFEALFASPERWDVIELNNIPSDSSTIELVRGICARAGQHVLAYDQFTCRTLRIREHRDAALEIFNKAGLRRRQNYFQRNGTLRFFNVTGMAVLPYLDQFFDQHVARWSSGKDPSLFLNECNRMFYRELAVDMAQKEWVLFSVVEFDGQPIAIHYGFDYNGSLLWYKPSFDVTYAKHSPGLVLLRYLIDYAIKQDRREFDFTIGDEAFKSRFTNHTRKTVSLKIIRDAGRFLIERAKRKLTAAVKRLS